MTRPMYEALRALFGLKDEPVGFECVTLAGVVILPDDIDYMQDMKGAEDRGYHKAMDIVRMAQKIQGG